MIRGTTPTHIFTIPFDTALIADLRIIYAQCGNEVLVKTKKDATLDGNTIAVTLSQEETFAFDCGKRVVDIQVRVLTLGGDALSSDIIITPIDRCLNDEVLRNET